MSNYCQNCYELTEEISKLKAENIRLCEYKDELQIKLKKIKEITETALKANYCNNCDGCGLPECLDTECHTYALDKIMDVIEGAEDER